MNRSTRGNGTGKVGGLNTSCRNRVDGRQDRRDRPLHRARRAGHSTKNASSSEGFSAMPKGVEGWNTYTIVVLFPLFLRWHLADNILHDSVHWNVRVLFQRGMGIDLLHLNDWDATHDNPLRFASGANPCLRHSCVLSGGCSRKGFFIGIQDSNGTRPRSSALLDLGSGSVS